MVPGPGFWFAMAEVRIVQWLLRQPTFHRFVGGIHKRYRQVRHGKTDEEIMEEMGGTNLKEDRGSLFRHFKDELSNQFRDLRGGGSRGKGGGGDGGGQGGGSSGPPAKR